MLTETDLDLADGRRLHVYDTGPAPLDAPRDGPVVFWNHGTPNLGSPPGPLLPASAERGVRWVSYDRPGYGGSTRRPGRDLAAAAADTSAVADALGVDRFAVMGHSGGANHALACAALLPDRVIAAVCVSGLAPLGAEGLDWFAGMAAAGAGELRAAIAGAAALEAHLALGEWDPETFTPADHAALAGEWSWFDTVVGPALDGGPGGMVDDDVAYVSPWGFEPGPVSPPVLFVHGEKDRMVPSSHGSWLAARTPSAALWLRPDDGHISVLAAGVAALGWLVDHAG